MFQHSILHSSHFLSLTGKGCPCFSQDSPVSDSKMMFCMQNKPIKKRPWDRNQQMRGNWRRIQYPKEKWVECRFNLVCGEEIYWPEIRNLSFNIPIDFRHFLSSSKENIIFQVNLLLFAGNIVFNSPQVDSC